MARLAVYDAVLNRLAAQWTQTPVVEWDEVDRQLRSTLESFLAVEFVSAPSMAMSIGAPGDNYYEDLGTISFYLFSPSGSDKREALQLLDDVSILFRGQQFDGVTCKAPSAPQTARSPSGSWQASVTNTPYYYRLTG